MRWWWIAVVLAFPACKKKQKEVGEECENILDCNCVGHRCQSGLPGSICEKNYQCDFQNDVNCVAGVCRGPGKRGEPCGECERDLTCHLGVCRDQAGVEAANAEVAEAKRKQEAEKERALLEQAGITQAPAAEAAPAAPGPGMRVRIVEITAKNDAFAACKPTERLTGGGCKSEYPLLGNFPSGQGAEDTVGARWNCTGKSNAEVTAYALCAKVTP